MPVSCKKIGGKWRVCGPDGEPEMKGDSPVDGGGHGKEDDCQSQADAMNANMKHSEFIRFVIPLTGLKFAGDDKKKTSDIQVCMVGKWEHDFYGTVEFTRQHLREMVANFKEGKRDLVVDYQHGSLAMDPEAAKAAGWIKDLYTKERGAQLWATVEWTNKAVKYIQAGEFKYISPECTTDGRKKETGEKLGACLFAVALTNRPFLEGMAPVELSEGAVFVTSIFQKSPERGAKTTQPKGGSRMDEKRIREVLGLTEDTAVTDDHRNQALKVLDEKLAEAEGKVTQLTEKSSGKVTLTEAEVTALRANAEAGSQAAKALKEMQVCTALKDAQTAGKIAGIETPLYAQVKKTLEANYADGLALIEALPRVVDFSVRGADGEPGGDAGADGEVKTFIDGRISGEKAVTMSVALSEAYAKFGKEKVNAWRYKEAS